MILEMKPDDFIISKTDTKGRLTYVNKIFMTMAEYSEEELLGKPHNIVRHPEMPKTVFKLLWSRIQNKEEIFAFVVNKTKKGNEYWVLANVTTSVDERGNIIGFYSVRRKPSDNALNIIKPLYAKMLQAERSGGIAAGEKVLNDALFQEGVSYDEFIIAIQG
ncbi:PAS domain-containing protein [Sulfurimonas sp.]|uniref:PAS domain-containing protein n=1 Tax=Sulfurimonas sp. TaxID=2022749 RepID=UPI00262B0682|nr:PAS domain-containing protein [Sulfurimonas sp.]